MALFRIFCMGDNGVQLTTTEAGNTGDNGDIPLTVVNPSNTARIIYDTTTPNPITEGSVIKLDNTSGNVNEVRKTLTGVDRGAWQMVFRLRSLVSAISIMGSCRSTSAGNIEMRLSSANFPALNANGTTFDTGATALNTTDLYVWDVWIEQGTTTANGKAKHRVRKINSDGTFTAVHTGTLFTDKNTGVIGTTVFDSWRYGKITSATTVGIDIIQMSGDDGATDYCPDPITGICGNDQTLEPWTTATLNAVGLGSWSQTAGSPTPTLSGSGKTRTYPVPKLENPASLEFSFGGDKCINTILPATDFLGPVGSLVPVRLRTGASITANGL